MPENEDTGVDCVRDILTILTRLETNQHVPLFLIAMTNKSNTVDAFAKTSRYRRR